MPTISSSFAEIERRRGGGGEQTKSIKYAKVETLLSDHLSTESHALQNPAAIARTRQRRSRPVAARMTQA
jgi:hypothetical protein